MIKGNLLDSKCDLLVNTVNCVGIMGKGIALDFKRKFPLMYRQYRQDCINGLYNAGDIVEYPLNDCRIIINFATKKSWTGSSNIDWIEIGLTKLYNLLNGTSYSIAIPALGCNNGKLNWDIVRNLIYEKLGSLSNHIELYEPKV